MGLFTRKTRLQITAATLLILVAAVGRSQTLVYEHQDQPLFSIEIPNGWLVDLDFAQEARQAGAPAGEEPELRVVEVSPGDGSHVWLGVWALPDAGTLDEGAAYFASLRQDLFTEVDLSPPATATLHGMSARTSKGTAVRDGEAVELAVALFEPRVGAIVAALYVGEPDAWRMHSEELEAMIESLEPVAP